MIKYGEWQIIPGSWSAQLNFGRSGNTANLDLKTILYLLTTCEIIMVNVLEIMMELIILFSHLSENLSPGWFAPWFLQNFYALMDIPTI